MNISAKRWIPAMALSATVGAAWAAEAGVGKGGNGFQFALAVGIGITAFVAWGRAAFPALAQRADRAAADTPASKTFWVGLANGLVAAIVALSIMKAGLPGPLGPLSLLSIILLAAVVGFRGALGIWPSYGHLILGQDAASTDLHATLAGGALLTGMLFFFPLGTLFFVYVVLRALGVSVLLMSKDPPKP